MDVLMELPRRALKNEVASLTQHDRAPGDHLATSL